MAFKAFLNGEEGSSVALLGGGSPGPREQAHYALFEVRVGESAAFIFTQYCQETHQHRVCEVFAGAAIHLFVAGSDTPFTLVTLRGPSGWPMSAVVWALALFGVDGSLS